MTFYNTIQLQEPELSKARVRAKSQEERIYSLMLEGGGPWTATSLNELFPQMIKTSIRRSLTDLHKAKKIEWIDWADGPHGKKEGLYRAAKQTKLF